MKICFIGDIYGKTGRSAVQNHLAAIRNNHSPDIIIANVDNAAHGFGVTSDIATRFFDMGIDVLTGGDHIWNQRDILTYIGSEPRLLRPANMPDGAPGTGYSLVTTASGKTCLVVHLLGRTFMDPVDDPFKTIQDILNKNMMGPRINAIFVDFHAEATSEKNAMAHYVDGRVSAIIGTHTHIPTADHRVFPNGTGYMTDAGMTGDYNSVIGAEKTEPLNRFVKKMNLNRMQPADGEGTLCAVIIETNGNNGLCNAITPLRMGPHLDNTH